jgi:hypothetical protein
MMPKDDVRYRGFERLKFIQTCSSCDVEEGAEMKLMSLSWWHYGLGAGGWSVIYSNLQSGE